MNADVIRKMAEVSLSGAMPFPEIVGNPVKQGVEYYHVDYLALSFSFFGAGGGVVVSPLTLENLPEPASDVDVAALRGAILDSQQHGQAYRQFCQRALMAGVQS